MLLEIIMHGLQVAIILCCGILFSQESRCVLFRRGFEAGITVVLLCGLLLGNGPWEILKTVL